MAAQRRPPRPSPSRAPITDAEPTSALTPLERELFDAAMAELQPMGHVGGVDLFTVTL